jgi:hypothetical protein
MSRNYWSDPTRWPSETRSYLSMAEAVLAIGTTTISGWSGNEAADHYGLLPGLRHFHLASRADRCEVHHLLAREERSYQPRPQFMQMPPNLSGNGVKKGPMLEDYDISLSEYERALEIIREKNSVFLPGADRFRRAKDEFIRAATMGEFVTATRSVGMVVQFEPIDPDIWSIVQRHNVFTLCVLNPSEPNSVAFMGAGFLPVMVEKTSFEPWLAECRGQWRMAGPPVATPSASVDGDTVQPSAAAQRPLARSMAVRKGKPPIDDNQWLKAMHALVLTGMNESPAANKLLDERGLSITGQSREAKHDRLRTKYRKLREQGKLNTLLGE